MANILVVGGIESIRGLLHRELTDEGHTVDAIDVSDSLERHLALLNPDLVLLDLYAGNRNEMELIKLIKGMRRQLPIVIFDVYVGFDDSHSYQVQGRVLKRSVLFALKFKVRELLEQKKTQSAHDANGDPCLLVWRWQ